MSSTSTVASLLLLLPDIISLAETGTSIVLRLTGDEYELQSLEEFEAETDKLREYALKGD